MIIYKTYFPPRRMFQLKSKDSILFHSKIKLFLSIGYVGFIVSSCGSNEKEVTPDVGHIVVDLKLVRFERELFKLDTNNLNREVVELTKAYPSFTKLYFEQLLSLTEHVDSINVDFLNGLKLFVTDSSYLHLNSIVQKHFSEKEFPKNELTKSLQFMKHYFPSENEPVFFTLISGFSYGSFIFQESEQRDGIGIGLDFFLGPAFDYSRVDPKNPAFSTYLNRSFNKDHLLKKTWEAWLEDRLSEHANGRLLDYLVQRGKKLYTLEKLLPEIQDTVLFEFTPKQLEWCNQNKVEIWAFFLANNLLYSTELLKFNKYINPSPSSPGMPADAPGQTGNYIGYQIIKAYMKRHPQLTIPDLWAITDSQLLLNEARFKPRND